MTSQPAGEPMTAEDAAGVEAYLAAHFHGQSGQRAPDESGTPPPDAPAGWPGFGTDDD